MKSSVDKLTQTLKNNGYSATLTRKAVFLALEKSKPLTMKQLVSKLDCKTHRTSAYRTVELFEQLGIIQRIQIGWKYKLELSNEFQDHHHHILCVKCGCMISFQEPEELHATLRAIADKNKFNLETHHIELQGVCQNCQTKQTTTLQVN